MGLSDSILRQALSDNTGEELVMQEIKRVQQIEKAKQDLLGDPSKLDNLAASLGENYTPSLMKPKNLSKYSSKAEGVDSNIPEDHPFAGMGREMKGRLASVLADPQYKGVSADELVQRIGQSYLLEPSGENKRPRIEQAYRYKREKDAGLKMSLNPFSEDSSLRKLPGYEQWHEATRGAEDEKLASESFFASGEDLAEATAWGAGVGAAIGAVTGGPVGAAVEGGIGAVASPILEVFAHPVRRALQGTEWYRSKISSDSGYENAKALGFEIATDIGIAMGGVKAGSKLLRKSTKAVDAGRKLLDGDIRKLLTSGKAQDATAASNSWKNVHGAEIEMKAALDRFRSGTMEAGQWQFYSGRKKITGPDDAIDLVERGGIYEMASDVGRMIKGEQRALPGAQKLLTAPDEEVSVVATKVLTPKKMFNKLTDRGADKALKEGVAAGDLDGAITKAFQEESVVLDVVKKEANDYISLLTKKEAAGKPVALTEKARAKLQAAGYDVDEIGTMERRKLLRLADSVREEKAVVSQATKQVSKFLDDVAVPAELTPEAQGIGRVVSAEEAVDIADREIAGMLSEAESVGYLESMLETGKLEASKIIQHEGPVTSSSAIDIPAVERMIPQEALIEDFIYDKLEDQFAKKYGDQFWRWTSPEVYDKVVPDEKAQAAIQKGYEFLQKKYGYDLKTMVPSKQKAILKYGSKEGHEKIEFENSVKEIRSLFDGEKLLGPLGVGMLAALTVPIASLISVPTAEAGGFSSTAKIPSVLAGIMKKVSGAGEEAKVAFMKGLREGRYIPGELKAGQKTVDEKYFGRQMHIMEDAKKAGVKTKDMFKYKKPLPFGIHNLMSPAGIANVAYKTGFSVAIQRAHLQTLWAVHTRDMTRVVENILRDVPGYKSSADEIANMTKPFVDKYASVQAARAMEHRLKSMETAIERLQKKALSKKLTPKALRENDEALNKAEMGRELLRKEFDRMKPAVDQFELEFGKLEQDIAKKFSSARIFYAAEDTSDFSLRPWLRGMVSYEEEIAAGHVKSLMDVYAKRMLAGGHKVITDRPFMHHSIHPKYQAEKAQELLSKVGINVDGHGAFTKFFKREKYSKSFIPDIQYTMNKYIPDAEKRILVSDFWRKRGSKEFRQGGWYSHMRSYEVQNNKMLSSFWNRLYTADEPEMRTVGNRLANWYTAFETAALIGFSPATAFKHVFKNQGTWGQLGFANAISHVPEAIGTASRNWLNSAQVQDGLTMRAFRKLGIDTSVKGRALDKFADAMIHQHKMMHYMSDMQVPGLDPGLASKVDNMLFKFNQKGSFMVAAIESFDRAHSFHAALDMAVNKGMSGKQAVYGIFDTILKNNFLGGGLNPEWMRKPVVRAVFLFQNTPFKIMERRLVNGIQTYQNVKTAIGVIKKQDLRKTLGELRDLKRYIKSGEDEIKKNLIGDALFHDKDVFGTPVTKQFMREFIYVGATIYGLGSLFDADFHPHSFHVPFISTFGGDKPELGVSPMAGAIYKGLTRKRESVDETGQEVGWVSQFFQDWLGRKQFVPQTFYKLNRISENDIPEAYKDSSLRYLFAVPSLEK